jgi:hypothetical protein
LSSVFVTTTAEITRYAPYARANYERVLRAAKADAVGTHCLAKTPNDADFVLFVESTDNYHFDLLRSPIYRTHKEKSYLFDTRDNTIPLIPGIYMSIPTRLHGSDAYRYGFYIRVFDNQVLREYLPAEESAYLFSFVGKVANCPAVRAPLLSFDGQRAFTRDASSGQADNDAEYARIMERSKFVLCPRGYGPSTWRLFETMRAGRVPVIISDDWAEPPRLPWAKFSVRVPEREINSIPETLAGLEDRASDMGHIAAQVWRHNFSLSRAFNWIAETLQTIHGADKGEANRTRLAEVLTHPRHRWAFIKERLRRMIQGSSP